MIEYKKLFMLLKERGMKKTDLLEIITSPTLAKLGKNETVKSDTIDKICMFLEVQPNDIMEVYKEEELTPGETFKIKTIKKEDLTKENREKQKKEVEKIIGIPWEDFLNTIKENGTINKGELKKLIEEKLT